MSTTSLVPVLTKFIAIGAHVPVDGAGGRVDGEVDATVELLHERTHVLHRQPVLEHRRHLIPGQELSCLVGVSPLPGLDPLEVRLGLGRDEVESLRLLVGRDVDPLQVIRNQAGREQRAWILSMSATSLDGAAPRLARALAAWVRAPGPDGNRAPAPVAKAATAVRATAVIPSLVTIMVLRTPLVRPATDVGMTVAADSPAASRKADWTTECDSAAGTTAARTASAVPARRGPPGRGGSAGRAAAPAPATAGRGPYPGGNRVAAAPRRCQALEVAEHDRVRGTGPAGGQSPRGARPALGRARIGGGPRRRDMAAPRAFVRPAAGPPRPWHAWPIAEGDAMEPAAPPSRALRTEPALRARTRNVAWKASSASCASSPRTCRQTRSTIGPCRSTSAVKPASVGPARAAAGHEPVQQLAVREVPDRPELVERLETLQRNGVPCPARHRLAPPCAVSPW